MLTGTALRHSMIGHSYVIMWLCHRVRRMARLARMRGDVARPLLFTSAYSLMARMNHELGVSIELPKKTFQKFQKMYQKSFPKFEKYVIFLGLFTYFRVYLL